MNQNARNTNSLRWIAAPGPPAPPPGVPIFRAANNDAGDIVPDLYNLFNPLGHVTNGRVRFRPLYWLKFCQAWMTNMPSELTSLVYPYMQELPLVGDPVPIIVRAR